MLKSLPLYVQTIPFKEDFHNLSTYCIGPHIHVCITFVAGYHYINPLVRMNPDLRSFNWFLGGVVWLIWKIPQSYWKHNSQNSTVVLRWQKEIQMTHTGSDLYYSNVLYGVFMCVLRDPLWRMGKMFSVWEANGENNKIKTHSVYKRKHRSTYTAKREF